MRRRLLSELTATIFRVGSKNIPSWQAPHVTGAPVGRHEYAEVLLTGGFPEARARADAARTRFFTSYIDKIVERRDSCTCVSAWVGG